MRAEVRLTYQHLGPLLPMLNRIVEHTEYHALANGQQDQSVGLSLQEVTDE